jgi:hypothetical protein
MSRAAPQAAERRAEARGDLGAEAHAPLDAARAFPEAAGNPMADAQVARGAGAEIDLLLLLMALADAGGDGAGAGRGASEPGPRCGAPAAAARSTAAARVGRPCAAPARRSGRVCRCVAPAEWRARARAVLPAGARRHDRGPTPRRAPPCAHSAGHCAHRPGRGPRATARGGGLLLIPRWVRAILRRARVEVGHDADCVQRASAWGAVRGALRPRSRDGRQDRGGCGRGGERGRGSCACDDSGSNDN